MCQTSFLPFLAHPRWFNILYFFAFLDSCNTLTHLFFFSGIVDSESVLALPLALFFFSLLLFDLLLLITIVQKLVRKLVRKPACVAVFSVSRQRKYDMIHSGVPFGAVPERPRWPLILPRRRKAGKQVSQKVSQRETTLPERRGLIGERRGWRELNVHPVRAATERARTPRYVRRIATPRWRWRIFSASVCARSGFAARLPQIDTTTLNDGEDRWVNCGSTELESQRSGLLEVFWISFEKSKKPQNLRI